MSSGFVTETELEARRKSRQEEWEKVRKPDEPKEAPEEEYDSRSLFERLDEQRQKKQIDWEEEHKLKNQIRGLNDDEVDFLDKVDDYKTEWEKQRIIEERKELEEYQKKQTELREKEMEERLKNERKVPEVRKLGSYNKNSQMKLLAGAVKRKADVGKPPEKKKTKDGDAGSDPIKDTRPYGTETTSNGIVAATYTGEMTATPNGIVTTKPPERHLSSCSGYDLLGLGDYGSESDEDESD